jgi:hypothetical protein
MPRQGVLHRQPPVGHQQQNRGRGELLGDRPDIEHGLRGDPPPVVEIGKALNTLPDDLPLYAYSRRTPGIVRLDRAMDDGLVTTRRIVATTLGIISRRLGVTTTAALGQAPARRVAS